MTGISEEMRSLFDGQKKLHETILKLQAQITEEEAAYLEETPHGNIIRGWDGFIDSKQPRKDTNPKKTKPYTEAEHLFSSCCFYTTLGSEPTVDLVDFSSKEDIAANNNNGGSSSTTSGRRKLTVTLSGGSINYGTPSSSSTTTNIGSASGNTGASGSKGSSATAGYSDRKAAVTTCSAGKGNSVASASGQGKASKIKKRKRSGLDRTNSTASEAANDDGEALRTTSEEIPDDDFLDVF